MRYLMKKTISIATAIIALAFPNHLSAQVEFSHSTGMGIYSSSQRNSGWGFIYSPKLNLYNISDEVSTSIGSNMGFGFSKAPGGSTMFVFDLPASIDLNFGFGSTEGANSTFGGFLGGGYGINYMPYNSIIPHNNVIRSGYATTHGLVVTGGVRTLIKGVLPFTVRFSHLRNSEAGMGNVFAFSMLYIFL